MKVTAIVVTHNGSKCIDKCINSLLLSSIEINIVVVDNASKDRTINVLETFPRLHIIRNSKNLGFGRANNIGIKQALSEGANYLFLINQDAWVEKNTIEILVQNAENLPEYFILSPVHKNSIDNGYEYYFGQYLKNSLNKVKQSSSSILQHDQVIEIKFVNAALWLLPKNTFDMIGGFDPLFFHYGEDNDYINRLFFHGYKVGVITKAIGYHDRHPIDLSAQKDSKFFRLCVAKTLSQLKDINQPLSNAFYNCLFRLIKECGKMLIFLRLKALLIEIAAFAYAILSIFVITRHRNTCKSKGAHFLNRS